MALQNLVLDGKKARFDWIKPFDAIVEYASRQAWLPLKDLFCNQEIEFDFTLENIKIVFETLQLQPTCA